MSKKQHSEFTFKDNINRARHGWIRLTPAYSVRVVEELLQINSGAKNILDPFSGTGTTGLVSASYGLNAELIDINPFLVWLATVKSTNYSHQDLISAQKSTSELINKAYNSIKTNENLWTPRISNIEQWWSKENLLYLSSLYTSIQKLPEPETVKNLAKIAFCKTLMQWSNVSYGHQSLSFKKNEPHQPMLIGLEIDKTHSIYESFSVNFRQIITQS